MLRVILGPKIKTCPYSIQVGIFVVRNDPATIAKEIKLKDLKKYPVVRMPRQAAKATRHLIGDGTSTATLLAEVISAEHRRDATTINGGEGGKDLTS